MERGANVILTTTKTTNRTAITDMRRPLLAPLTLITALLSACGAEPEAVSSSAAAQPPTEQPAEQAAATESTAEPATEAQAPAGPLPGVTAYHAGDFTTALPLLKTEAEGGDAEAQLLYGQAHFHGHATPRNYAQARHWLRRAADQNQAEAQHRLAEMHAYGYGGERDLVTANEWARKARENGWGTDEAPTEDDS